MKLFIPAKIPEHFQLYTQCYLFLKTLPNVQYSVWILQGNVKKLLTKNMLPPFMGVHVKIWNVTAVIFASSCKLHNFHKSNAWSTPTSLSPSHTDIQVTVTSSPGVNLTSSNLLTVTSIEDWRTTCHMLKGRQASGLNLVLFVFSCSDGPLCKECLMFICWHSSDSKMKPAEQITHLYLYKRKNNMWMTTFLLYYKYYYYSLGCKNGE